MSTTNKIYALCDYQTLQKFDISLKDFLNICNQHNTVYIQYRDKLSAIDIQKQNVLFLKKHAKIPIIINDKLDLLEFADGLHLGQEDINKVFNNLSSSKEMTLKLIRKKHPNKIIGLSTHNELEILEANKLDLDYIGLGAYKNTTTKDVSNILGDNISYLAKISKHPVGAIGGVNVDDDIPNIYYNVVGSGLLKNH